MYSLYTHTYAVQNIRKVERNDEAHSHTHTLISILILILTVLPWQLYCSPYSKLASYSQECKKENDIRVNTEHAMKKNENKQHEIYGNRIEYFK